MEFKRPKPKKNSTSKGKLKLPSKNEKEMLGVFNGQFVTVHDWNSMNYLYQSGNFGKGTLSKGQPSYNISKDDISKIMLEHQFENHVKWNANTSYSHTQKYLGCVRNDFKLSVQSVTHFLKSSFDGDNEQETWKSWKKKHEYKPVGFSQGVDWAEFKTGTSDYRDEVFCTFVNGILQSGEMRKPPNTVSASEEVIVLSTSFNPHSTHLLTDTKAVLKKLPIAFEENLNLSLEESFFLKSVLGCLNIVDLDFTEIGIQDLWEKFNSVNKNFTERYIVYNHYRSKGWVLRSGLKFGGDYLLYKDGPASYHASYLVKVLDKRKELTWRELIAMNRLVETFNKDLLLCYVQPNETAVNSDSYPNAITNHSVQEVLIRRWFPTKERCAQESTSN